MRIAGENVRRSHYVGIQNAAASNLDCALSQGYRPFCIIYNESILRSPPLSLLPRPYSLPSPAVVSPCSSRRPATFQEFVSYSKLKSSLSTASFVTRESRFVRERASLFLPLPLVLSLSVSLSRFLFSPRRDLYSLARTRNLHCACCALTLQTSSSYMIK